MISNGDYKSLSVLFIALIAGVLLFSLVSILLHFTIGAFMIDIDMANWFFAISIFVTAIVIMFQRSTYRNRIQALQEGTSTEQEKFERLRSILISYAAMCEFFAIIGIILFILFGNWPFFLLTAMALVEMGRKFPVRSKIESIINIF